MLTQEKLKELLNYDPSTGLFTRRVSAGMGGRIVPGSAAGSPMGRGYLRIILERRAYSAHRLAWLYVYGEWPPIDIDHINRVKDDNRIVNLRLATRAQNIANTKHRNPNGFKGVSFRKDRGKWSAKIRLNGKQQALGYFSTPEDAHAAYRQAAERQYGEFARAE